MRRAGERIKSPSGTIRKGIVTKVGGNGDYILKKILTKNGSKGTSGW